MSNANKWSENVMNRTEAFFDAVIAIAMNMIALEISLPDIEIFDYTAFKTICQEMIASLPLAVQRKITDREQKQRA